MQISNLTDLLLIVCLCLGVRPASVLEGSIIHSGRRGEAGISHHTDVYEYVEKVSTQ
jgi:hypothetical protein